MPAQGKRLGAIRLVGAAAWIPFTRRKLRAAFQEPSYAYGNGRAFPRSIVTSGLLTIDSVMALSRDSLMRPLTKLRARGVSIPYKLRILVRTIVPRRLPTSWAVQRPSRRLTVCKPFCFALQSNVKLALHGACPLIGFEQSILAEIFLQCNISTCY